MQDGTVSYKPSAWYYRKALRGTDDPERLRNIGLSIVAEMERLREWVRECGDIPPKWTAPEEEAREKGWL